MCVRVATDKHTLCILPFRWLSSALAVASVVGILHNSDIATARAPKRGPGPCYCRRWGRLGAVASV